VRLVIAKAESHMTLFQRMTIKEKSGLLQPSRILVPSMPMWMVLRQLDDSLGPYKGRCLGSNGDLTFQRH
jgi:hypothetical protein